jgi:hypothetical protein
MNNCQHSTTLHTTAQNGTDMGQPDTVRRYLTRGVDYMSRQVVRRRQQQRPMDIQGAPIHIISQQDVQHAARDCSWLGRPVHVEDCSEQRIKWYNGVSLRGVAYKVRSLVGELGALVYADDQIGR